MKTWLKVALGLTAISVLSCGGLVAAVVSTFASDAPPVEGVIADGVHAVVDSGVVSYIVEVNGGVVLVDAGMDPEATAIKAKLADLNDPKVFALLLTHAHGDHVGGCQAFRGVPVIAHRDEIPLVQGEASFEGWVPRFMTNDGSCQVTQGVTDGGQVNLGRMVFKAYHLPGHTPGSVAWLGRRTLFLGDAASASVDGTVTGAKWIFNDDTSQAHASLAGLADRFDKGAVRTLAFGHTGPLDKLKPLAAYD